MTEFPAESLGIRLAMAESCIVPFSSNVHACGKTGQHWKARAIFDDLDDFDRKELTMEELAMLGSGKLESAHGVTSRVDACQ